MNHTSRLLAQAQGLTNPAVPGLQTITSVSGDSGTRGAAVLGFYIALIIQTALVLSGLAVLVYLFMGAFGWITAGGDSGKIEKAREKIVQSIIGLAVMFSIVALLGFIGPIFGMDLLMPTFVNQLSPGGFDGSSSTGGSSLPGISPSL